MPWHGIEDYTGELCLSWFFKTVLCGSIKKVAKSLVAGCTMVLSNICSIVWYPGVDGGAEVPQAPGSILTKLAHIP